MQRLKAQQLSALVLELATGLPQLGRQRAGEVGYSQVGKKIGEDYGLQSFGITRGRELIGRDLFKIRKLQQRAKQGKGDACGHIGPITRQEDAGDNDHQRVKKIEEGVYSAGHVDHGCGKNQISKDLEDGLLLVLVPQGEQHHKKDRDRVPDKNYVDEQTGRNIVGSEVD